MKKRCGHCIFRYNGRCVRSGTNRVEVGCGEEACSLFDKKPSENMQSWNSVENEKTPLKKE